MSANRKPAVVLVSGGLDSTVALAEARAAGFDCYAMSFQYGQRHQVELQAARNVAAAQGALKHVEIELNLRSIGGSALTADINVPKHRDESEMSVGIPVTYVPARNTVFLAIALGWAETLGAFDLFIGVNAIDYSGYPDCRPEFIKAFESLANLATQAGVEGKGSFQIHAPLQHMTKADIVRRGLELGVDFSLTHSCYDPTPEDKPCGACDSCLLRAKGFADAGVEDPALKRG